MKIIITILVLFTVLTTTGLVANDKMILTGTYNRVFFSQETVDMYGVNLEIFISKNVSVNYSLTMGNSHHGLHLHTTAGVVGGIYLFGLGAEDEEEYYEDEEGSSGFLYGSSIVSMLLPEGINVHFPLSRYISVCASIHPFGYNYFKEGNSLSSSLGVKLIYNLSDNLVLIPHAGLSLLYNHRDVTTYNMGLSFGFKL
ncbi:hypothetical protein ACFLSQ_01335 [Bacteroidota bacterium]